MAKIRNNKWLILFCVLTVLDILSTHYVTPDLKHEANPIVIKYQFGWPGFVAFISFSTLFFVTLFLFHKNHFKYLNTNESKNIIDFAKGAIQIVATQPLRN